MRIALPLDGEDREGYFASDRQAGTAMAALQREPPMQAVSRVAVFLMSFALRSVIDLHFIIKQRNRFLFMHFYAD